MAMAHLVPIAAAVWMTASAPVPPALVTLERVADEIDAAAAAGSWSTVERLEAQGEQALGALHGDGSPGLLDRARAALADAETATQARSTLPTRLAANRLASAVVELYAPHHPEVPTSVMRLDVLLRAVDLAALAGMPASARPPLDEACAIWGRIGSEPPLVGSRARASFERHLANLRRAVDAGDVSGIQRSALAALDEIHGVGDVYLALSARRARPVVRPAVASPSSVPHVRESATSGRW
jgi:hypothetical protein